MIEDAYTLGQSLGLDVWCTDQAGPFQAIPQPGQSWKPVCHPARRPSEYVRGGTAKLMTLFHPADGHVRVRGVTSCTNEVLHGWLKTQLAEIVDGLPPLAGSSSSESDLQPVSESRQAWERWQAGLSLKPTLSAKLPPLRMLLILDNLAGHKNGDFVCWLFAHGIMPLYTPLGGSWLNMAESLQRILKRRALDGQQPDSPAQILAWLEAVADHWNRDPTPFVWGGKRVARRQRQRARHRVGGSGACTDRPVHPARIT